MAAQEAVALRRTLAKARPDAFTPDLAMSLGALSDVLIAQNRRSDAKKALHEAITILLPLFLKGPAAFQSLILQLCRNYVEMCKEQKHEPDLKLLSPIITVFEQLQNK